LRSGVGLLTVHVPQKLYDIIQISVNEAICTLDSSNHIITSCFGSGVYGSKETIGSHCDLDKYSAIAIGPGIGKAPDTVSAFKELLKFYDNPMVIDADAINILSSHKEMLKYVPEFSILTPHPKEFRRMVGDYANTEEAIEKQVNFSRDNRVIIVLKGANTSISTPDGMLYFNSTGNPGMATAGSGDVLCGVLLGLLAQGYTPEASAIIGVYLHSLSGDIAAEKLGQESLIAGDIIENLGGAFLKISQKSSM
jgi:NAD(P)H-hydrate epimerase